MCVCVSVRVCVSVWGWVRILHKGTTSYFLPNFTGANSFFFVASAQKRLPAHLSLQLNKGPRKRKKSIYFRGFWIRKEMRRTLSTAMKWRETPEVHTRTITTKRWSIIAADLNIGAVSWRNVKVGNFLPIARGRRRGRVALPPLPPLPPLTPSAPPPIPHLEAGSGI